MARVRTGASRVWLDPEFAGEGRLPPYPSPPGTWDELFAAIEVEAAEHALKAVRLELSIRRKPASGRDAETRAVFDEVVALIDAELGRISAFAWGDEPGTRDVQAQGGARP